MVSMLDVIKRSEDRCKYIIENRKEIFKQAIEFVGNNKINQIVFVGSGSSYSTALTSMLFVEKASGIQVTSMLPNVFNNKTVYDKDALYIFVSQTGTSGLTTTVARKVKELGCHTLALCGDEDAPVSKACEMFALIGCGQEEYTYATLGFTSTVMSEMLLGIEIGLATNYLSIDDYNKYIDEAIRASESNTKTIEKTLAWYEKHKDKLLKAENFVFYGGNSLWGVGNEGALKIMEITKHYLCAAYEMDDGMHGQNYCLDERQITFALNDGKDKNKATAIMKLMKNEYNSGYMVGLNTIDENDLALDIQTEDFTNIEMLPFVQVLAYSIAISSNVPIYTRDDSRLQKTKGKGYFNMHDAQN